jgi:hypothetical protein
MKFVKGFVYILVNESFKYIKIGYSERDPNTRANELFNTGVPTPFIVAYEVLVKSPEQVEELIHRNFEKYRVAKNREFFDLSAATAISKIKILLSENGIEVLHEEKYIKDAIGENEIIFAESTNLVLEKKTLENEEAFLDAIKLPTIEDIKYQGQPYWKLVKLKYGNRYANGNKWVWPHELHEIFSNLFGVDLAEYGLFISYLILNHDIPVRFLNISQNGKISYDDSNIILDISLTHILNLHRTGDFHITKEKNRSQRVNEIIIKLEGSMPRYYKSLPEERVDGEVSPKWYTTDESKNLFASIVSKVLAYKNNDFPVREIYLISVLTRRFNKININISDGDLSIIADRIFEGSLTDSYLFQDDLHKHIEIQLLSIMNLIYITYSYSINFSEKNIEKIAKKVDSLFLQSATNEFLFTLFLHILTLLFKHHRFNFNALTYQIIKKLIYKDELLGQIKAYQLKNSLPEFHIDISRDVDSLLNALCDSIWAEVYPWELGFYISK